MKTTTHIIKPGDRLPEGRLEFFWKLQDGSLYVGVSR